MSYSFNGTTSFLESPTPIALTATFSISVFVYSERLATPEAPAGVYIPSDSAAAGSGILLTTGVARANYDFVQDVGALVPLSGWIHLVCTVDAAVTTVHLFENGVSAGALTVAPRASHTLMTLVRMGLDDLSGSGFQGKVAEMSVFSGLLTQPQAASLSGGTNPVVLGPTLLFYSDLRNNAVDVVSGSSLTNNAATLDLLEHPLVDTTPSFSLSRFPTQVAVMAASALSPLSTPLVLDLFQAQWAQSVRVNSAWLTDVTQSSDQVAEERRSLVDRPTREQQVAIHSLDQDLATRLLMFLSRIATARVNVPFYPEVLVLTATLAPGASQLPVYDDASYRRLYPGSRIVIMDPDGVVEYALIDKVFPDHVTLTAGLTNGFPINCVWLPVIDAEISITHTTQPLTDEMVSATATFTEVVGESALPALVPAGTTPGFYPVHSDGRMIFSGPIERSLPLSVQILRSGEQFTRGRGDVVLVRGDRPQYQFAFTARCLTRAEAWGVITLFDSVQGRTGLWWLPNPLTLFEISSVISTTVIRVTAMGNLDDFQDFLTHVASSVDSAWLIHEIVSITDPGGGLWEITITEALSTTVAADIEFFTSAHLVRFTNDSLEEVWHTDGIVDIPILAREVLEEAAVAIPNLDDILSFDGDILQTTGLSMWYEANFSVFTYVPGTPVIGAPGQPAQIGGDLSRWERVPNAPPPGTIGDTGYIGSIQLIGKVTYVAPTSAFALNNSHGIKLTDVAKVPAALQLPPVLLDEAMANKFYGSGTGFTFFCVFHDATPTTPGSNHLCMLRAAGKFEFYCDEVKLFATFGVNVPADNITYADLSPAQDVGVIFTCRWDPGVETKAWSNGVPLGTASNPVAAIPLTPVVAGTGFLEIFPVTGSITILTLLNVARALTNNEANIVGQVLGSKYNIQWTDIV